MRSHGKIKKSITSKADPFIYTEEEIDIIKAHIKKYFGEYKSVFHEIASSDIHLDIAIITPTPERNHYTLVTMGAGAYEMNAPREWRPNFPTQAEYLIILPPDWDIENLDNPKNYWPIHLVKTLARLPINNDTCLGIGHTMSLDDENTPFAENTKLCSIVLTHPKGFEDGCITAALPNSKNVVFYQIIPIYEDELNFIREHSFGSFEEHIRNIIKRPLDINRSSVIPAEEEHA